MHPFNVYLHRQHSLKYFLLVYGYIFVILAIAAIVAEAFFIK